MTRTALILDDDVVCRTLLAEIVRAKNILVSSFTDPGSYFATQPVQGEPVPYDYILTDNQMPGMTGIEFLRKLADLGWAPPKDRVAIISGSWTDDDLQKARELGCRIFSKPYQVRQLHQWLDS